MDDAACPFFSLTSLGFPFVALHSARTSRNIPKNVNILSTHQPLIPIRAGETGGRGKGRETYKARNMKAILACFLEQPIPGGEWARQFFQL